jgi:hypothetical protein
MSIETHEQRPISVRQFAHQLRRIFADITLITGERPQSIGRAGDEIEVNWGPGVSQRVRLAHVHAGADEIRTRRREFASRRQREREEFRAYTRKATREAARAALERMGG